MTGFRKTISDNIPFSWDIALRWCKKRNDFIERAYKIHVEPFSKDPRLSRKDKHIKKEECIKKYINDNGKFEDAIDMLNMIQYGHKDTKMWQTVSSWEVWFSKKIKEVQPVLHSNFTPDVTHKLLVEALSKHCGASSEIISYLIDKICEHDNISLKRC